jgi:hypothetical protein
MEGLSSSITLHLLSFWSIKVRYEWGKHCSQSKIAFERFATTCGHKIKSFRADKMPFASKEFQADLVTKGQEITFSGVGAHNQNGVAERAIQTVTQWASSMLLHHALHWPEQTQLDLWPFALEHAVYLWNHLPRKDSMIAPVELFTGATFDNFEHIQRARVWGCPIYVLDPKLQDGHKNLSGILAQDVECSLVSLILTQAMWAGF